MTPQPTKTGLGRLPLELLKVGTMMLRASAAAAFQSTIRWRGAKHPLYLVSFSGHGAGLHIRFASSTAWDDIGADSAPSNRPSALVLLNLADRPNFTPSELRDAYFAAAKSCHPDSNTGLSVEGDGVARFLRVTEAYELLRRLGPSSSSGVSSRGGRGKGRKGDYAYADWYDEQDYDTTHIRRTEEDEFRKACREWLGVDAETVEESKRCPLFREWLRGKTDAAFHWNTFFMLNGGLVPRLRPAAGRIGAGDAVGEGRIKDRRRRAANRRKRSPGS